MTTYSELEQEIRLTQADDCDEAWWCRYCGFDYSDPERCPECEDRKMDDPEEGER